MSKRVVTTLLALGLLSALLMSPVSAASKSHSVNGNTAITQTQYLYYNTGSCRGGTSASMYKTTLKWTRTDTSFTATAKGGTWGHTATLCSNGASDIYSRSLGVVSPISYGTTYSFSYTFPYVTNVGSWAPAVGANYKADVYRGTSFRATLCTATYIWSSGSPC